MWTISSCVDYYFITAVAEQMDNILSQAGSVQALNFEVTRTAICESSGADNILGTGRGKYTFQKRQKNNWIMEVEDFQE